MLYLIKNTSTNLTLMLESSSQWNNLILKPGDTQPVTEAALAQLNVSGYTNMGGLIPVGAYTVLGPTVDTNAPVALTTTLPGVGTWSLITLGKFCTNFQFVTTSTNCLVSFSGWISPDTAPPTIYQIPIIPDTTADGQAFTLNMVMDASRSFYVSGTGSLTIIGN